MNVTLIFGILEAALRLWHFVTATLVAPLEGRLGIERRNRLMQIRTRLQVAVTALAEADAIASAPMQDVLAELQENTARTQSSEEPETVELAEELPS